MGINIDGKMAAFESPEGYRQMAEEHSQKSTPALPDTEKTVGGGGRNSARRDAEDKHDHTRNHEKSIVPSVDKAKVKDPNEVGWDGPDDPANPYNWRMGRKWTAMTVVSLFTLMSPLASSMVAPALPIIPDEFGIKQGSVESSLILSFLFLAFNIACGRAKTAGQVVAFRFLAGLGASAPFAIGGGTISDLFTVDNRGRAMAVYTLAPLTGPTLGPVIGAW
ncbi:hypothetical protein FRB95_003065 [Tulasnella sp. JGI-2019a]|nr:hypothetical protein FRB95_003065 [Tulasnella sp. JGI-2019a]